MPRSLSPEVKSRGFKMGSYKPSSIKVIKDYNFASIWKSYNILLLLSIHSLENLAFFGSMKHYLIYQTHWPKTFILQVVTVAKFQGGGAFNVIPDSVTIGGTFRAFSKESIMQLKQRIEEVRQLNNSYCRTETKSVWINNIDHIYVNKFLIIEVMCFIHI